MIFVTVGTHEQPMDRLFVELDKLIESGAIKEEVFVQSGYARFKFRYCDSQSFLPYQEIEARMSKASLVICHGGPATIMQVRLAGKIPVVVPRQFSHGEHVNNHQVDFCRRLAQHGLIICVYQISDLESILAQYGPLTEKMRIPTCCDTGGSSSRDALCVKLTEYCRSASSSQR